jgi:hypothetical protein
VVEVAVPELAVCVPVEPADEAPLDEAAALALLELELEAVALLVGPADVAVPELVEPPVDPLLVPPVPPVVPLDVAVLAPVAVAAGPVT